MLINMKPFINKLSWATALILVVLNSPSALSQTFRGGADLKQYLTELTAAADVSNADELFSKLESVRSNEPVRTRAFSQLEETFEESLQPELLAWIAEDTIRLVIYEINHRVISKLTERFPREMLGLVKDACPHRALLRKKPKPTDLCYEEAPCDRCVRAFARRTAKWNHALQRATDEKTREELQTRIENLPQTVGDGCLKRKMPPLAALLAHEGKCHAGCDFCGLVVGHAMASLIASGEDILPSLSPLQDTPLHQEAVLKAVAALGATPAKARVMATMLEEQFPEYKGKLVEELLRNGGNAYGDEEIRAMRLGSTHAERVYSRRLLEARFKRHAPEEVIAWVNSHEPSRQRDLAYLRSAGLWLESDFNAAFNWVRTEDHGHLTPNLANRLASAAAVNKELSNEEFQEILHVAETSGWFQQPTAVVADLKGFFRNWAKIDKETCFEAMMNCTALSGSLEERCAQVLVVAPDGQLILDLQGDLRHLKR